MYTNTCKTQNVIQKKKTTKSYGGLGSLQEVVAEAFLNGEHFSGLEKQRYATSMMQYGFRLQLGRDLHTTSTLLVTWILFAKLRGNMTDTHVSVVMKIISCVTNFERKYHTQKNMQHHQT